MLKRYFTSIVVGAALALAACTSPTAQPLGKTAVDLQKAAYEAKLGFQAALVGAVFYVELPRCDKPTSPTICSKQDVVDIIRKTVTAADAATQAAEDGSRVLTPDTTVLEALVVGAQSSVKALQAVTPSVKK